LHALADGNQRIRIREKTLEFSTVLTTLSPSVAGLEIIDGGGGTRESGRSPPVGSRSRAPPQKMGDGRHKPAAGLRTITLKKLNVAVGLVRFQYLLLYQLNRISAVVMMVHKVIVPSDT